MDSTFKQGTDCNDEFYCKMSKICFKHFDDNQFLTKAITKRDHTPQQLLVTKQINVTDAK